MLGSVPANIAYVFELCFQGEFVAWLFVIIPLGLIGYLVLQIMSDVSLTRFRRPVAILTASVLVPFFCLLFLGLINEEEEPVFAASVAKWLAYYVMSIPFVLAIVGLIYFALQNPAKSADDPLNIRDKLK